MQSCDSKCGHCARNWFKWLKSREHQMNMPWEGAGVSFAEAARTSNRAPKPGEPCHCSFPADTKAEADVHGRKVEVVVVHNAGYVGLDGRHWVKVESKEGWTFHTTCGTLRSCATTSSEADF